MGKALETNYTVNGWRQGTGQLWLPNTIVRVRDELIDFDRDMLIMEVTYSLDETGTQYKGYKCIQVTNYVGVMLAPNGLQIEVLPKIVKVTLDTAKVRQLLIKMLCCLEQFRYIKMDRALIAAAKMPLLEVFIYDFLICASAVVKRGLRSNYITYQDNLFVLRGKIVTSTHLTKKHNSKRPFFL